MAHEKAQAEKSLNEVTVSADEYARALQAGNDDDTRAQSAHYDLQSKRLRIELPGEVAVMIPTDFIQGLQNASTKEIESVELLAGGYALHWPALDVDILVSELVAGVFGTKSWMAKISGDFLAEAGRKGGSASTRAKRTASRANGKLGGRPRKQLTA